MKYFLLAGEKSGDLHGANIVKAIKAQDNHAEVFAWGGDAMQAAGATILVHHKELSIMGLLGVLKNLARIRQLFKLFSSQIDTFQPDTLLFIDYGGFNLKAAKIAKLKGFHTQFYIAPKVWAWNYSRVKQIKQWIDELYVIFPFEKDLFSKEGISTHFEGNPIMDEIMAFQKSNDFIDRNGITQPYIALLPGSRKQEIHHLMPIFKSLALAHPEKSFVIAGVEDYRELFDAIRIPVIYQNTYNVVSHAQMAIVCSGTATLETALLQTPLVVVYKTDPIFFRLAKWVVKLKYISLVNIILQKLAVPELLQNEVNVTDLSAKINALFPTESIERQNQLEDFDFLTKSMGSNGVSERVAKILIEKAKLYSNNS